MTDSIPSSPSSSSGRIPIRKTKIVATLGPASVDKIKELILAGVNVFRINFSHAIHDEQIPIISNIRKFSEELGIPVAILGDLCGPKIRVGIFEDRKPITLVQGSTIRLRASDEPGNASVITTSTRTVVTQLQPGHAVLLDDGNYRLNVTKRISEDEIECLVMNGGLLKEKKGINVPELKLAVSALTEKDKRDAKFVLEQKLDYIALSFVQRPEDVIDLKDFIAEFNKTATEENHSDPLIIAKIEKPQALDDIDDIIKVVDAIMVARGDLGVEYSLERVPIAQKMLISKCNEACIPVITATQMLETMMNAPVPTRAEVSDVANAVFDGTDAVMLSGESAAGKYPIEAVKMMASICVSAETQVNLLQKTVPNFDVRAETTLKGSFLTAIADAAVTSANQAKASAIVAFTISGNMAYRISKRKPPQLVISVTHSTMVARRLALLWGINPIVVGRFTDTDSGLVLCEKEIKARGWLVEEDVIVFCSGSNELHAGLSNILKLHIFGHAGRSLQARLNWKGALDVIHRVRSVEKPAESQ